MKFKSGRPRRLAETPNPPTKTVSKPACSANMAVNTSWQPMDRMIPGFAIRSRRRLVGFESPGMIFESEDEHDYEYDSDGSIIGLRATTTRGALDEAHGAFERGVAASARCGRV